MRTVLAFLKLAGTSSRRWRCRDAAARCPLGVPPPPPGDQVSSGASISTSPRWSGPRAPASFQPSWAAVFSLRYNGRLVTPNSWILPFPALLLGPCSQVGAGFFPLPGLAFRKKHRQATLLQTAAPRPCLVGSCPSQGVLGLEITKASPGNEPDGGIKARQSLNTPEHPAA